jgi:plastocyanin
MHVRIGLVLLSIVALILAACGGSSSSQAPSASVAAPSASTAPSASVAAPSASASTSPSTAPSGSAATGGDTLHVGMRDFSFALDKASLPPGTAVAVTADNGGEAPHTITFYTDAQYTQKVSGGDSGTVNAGASKAFSFTPPDGATVLFFRCEIHPTQMVGQIDVKA